MDNGRYTVTSEAQTRELAARFAPSLQAGDFISLVGPLGAGKTTFVRGLLRELGYLGRVRSPTFTLIHAYATDPAVHHADLYRLSHPDELLALGFEEIREEGGVLLVEWADKVPGVDRLATREVRIEAPDDDSERRVIVLRDLGGRGEEPAGG